MHDEANAGKAEVRSCMTLIYEAPFIEPKGAERQDLLLRMGERDIFEGGGGSNSILDFQGCPLNVFFLLVIYSTFALLFFSL